MPAINTKLAGHLLAKGVRLGYPVGHGQQHQVLEIANLEIAPASLVAITGPSGAGKTSLLHVLMGIEQPQAGSIQWDGVDIAALPEAGRDRWRRERAGLIFQDFHLFPGMNALDNVLLPQSFSHWRPSSAMRQRAKALLRQVGAPDSDMGVETFSRGEQQRVALARALLAEPKIIAADEPTASLDSGNARIVIDLLVENAQAMGATLLVVTHDPLLVAAMQRVVWLEGGQLKP